MLEAEQTADEEAIEKLEEEEEEEEEKQQTLESITQASRQPKEHVVTTRRKKQQPHGASVAHSLQPKSFPPHSTAASLQSLHVPADLVLILQALSSEMNCYKIIIIIIVLANSVLCFVSAYRITNNALLTVIKHYKGGFICKDK